MGTIPITSTGINQPLTNTVMLKHTTGSLHDGNQQTKFYKTEILNREATLIQKQSKFSLQSIFVPPPPHRTAPRLIISCAVDLLGRASHRGGHRHALPRALPRGRVLSSLKALCSFQGWTVKGRSSWILRSCDYQSCPERRACNRRQWCSDKA